MSCQLSAAALIALLCIPSAGAEEADIEVLRDPWGIPHVFNDTEAGAFRGLGYATAADRAFQMIESWYPILLGTSTGTGGDTIRS